MAANRDDRIATRVVLGIALGRVAIGAGAVFATEATLKALRFGETDAAARGLARLAGNRDLGLGLATLASAHDRRRLRALALAAAAVDAADAVAFAAALPDERIRAAGLAGALSAVSAALGGLWAGRRLG